MSGKLEEQVSQFMDPNTPALKDKRLWLSLAAILVAVLNKKLGLNLEAEDLVFIGTLVTGYIVQSQAGAVLKAKSSGSQAAAQVKSPSAVLDALGGAKALVFAIGVALLLGALMPTSAMAQDAGVAVSPEGVSTSGATPAPVSVGEASVTIEKAHLTGAVLMLDNGNTAHVTGGFYLSEQAGMKTAQEIVALRAQVASLESNAPSWVVFTISMVGAIALGGVTGWALHQKMSASP